MKVKIIISTLITSAFGIFLYLTVTAPKSLAVLDYSAETSDLSNGEYIFTAAGCSGCHIEEGSKDKYLLAGGQKFETAFGTFKAPNISNSIEFGIGAWEFKDFYNALKLGQSPDGEHYFPTFPYTAYSKMTDQDIMDLWTFWKTLPSSEAFIGDHDLPFLFSSRRNIGVWKTLYMSDKFVSSEVDRGTYLVEALSHCAECHSPRNILGALKFSEWLEGAQDPSGKGRIPGISTEKLAWTEDEIIEYLSSGFTPDYDVAGGKMASVVENTSKLSAADRSSIAQYLLRIK